MAMKSRCWSGGQATATFAFDDDEGHSSLLALAAEGGHAQLVDLLLQRGADVNHQDETGITAMMRAANYNQPAVVLRLLRAGADLTLRSFDGETALQMATEEGHAECVEAFRTYLGEVAAGRKAQRTPSEGPCACRPEVRKAPSAEAAPSGDAVPEGVVNAAGRGDEAVVVAWLNGGDTTTEPLELASSVVGGDPAAPPLEAEGDIAVAAVAPAGRDGGRAAPLLPGQAAEVTSRRSRPPTSSATTSTPASRRSLSLRRRTRPSRGSALWRGEARGAWRAGG